jgi:hypothetical protein
MNTLLATTTMGISEGQIGAMIPIVTLVFGSLIVMVLFVARAFRGARETREREQSRREIAAYIAEGSMTPEQGERLMAAGHRPQTNCD